MGCAREGIFMDKLIFLGTAGDALVMAKQQRQSGGIIFQLAGNQLHLDPGPGALLAAKQAGINPRDTIAILATNDSLLRVNDVEAAISAMTLDGMDRHGVLLATKSVIGSESEQGRLSAWAASLVEGIVTLAPQVKVGVNEIMVLPLKTSGRFPDAIGLRIETHTLTLGYTGDSEWYETMAADYKDVDVLIVNVPEPDGAKEPGRMSLDQAARLIGDVQPKAALLTGFGSKLLEQDLMEAARQVQRTTRVNTIAAADKMVVELDQFRSRANN
jgi:ribonuclease BN (tRNA processing enzyme)